MSADYADTADLSSNFRAAMRQLASTVTIVTTEADGVMHGMTATAVTSLSAQPPALLVCINRSASIHPALRVGEAFCVNILSSLHAELCDIFGGKVEPPLRFNYGNWAQDTRGVPFLADAAATIFCSVDLLIDYGTHTIIVGSATSAGANPGALPLIYGTGRFLTVSVPAPN